MIESTTKSHGSNVGAVAPHSNGDRSTAAKPPRAASSSSRQHRPSSTLSSRSESGLRSSADASRPRAAASLLGKESLPIASDADETEEVDSGQAIEMEVVSESHVVPLGHEHVHAMLSNLDELSRCLKQSLRAARRMHDRLKTALNEENRAALTEAQIDQIDEFQQYLSAMQTLVEDLDALGADLRKHMDPGQSHATAPRSWTEWLKSDTAQKVIAALEVTVAMGFKFGAWYGVEAILPGKSDAFQSTAKTAWLVTQRVLLSLGLAAVGEYIPGTDGPRRWVNAGGDLATIQGFGQAIDQGIALAGQFGTNAASGQAAPSPGHIAGFGLVALGGALQTGALNKPILGIVDYWRGGEPVAEGDMELIETTPLRSDQRLSAAPSQFQAPGTDLERGTEPATAAGSDGDGVGRLIQDVHENHVPTMRQDISRAFNAMSSLQKVLVRQTASAEEAEAIDTLLDASGQALLQAPPTVDPATQIAQIKANLVSIQSAALTARDSLPPNDELRAQIDMVFQQSKKMEEGVIEASKNLTPHESAFLWAMTGLGTTGLLLSFIGPPTGNEWLSNVNNRAAILGLTSSIGQNLANLGQFLGGAKPGDGRMMRFLKIGLDSENDNPVVKFAKDWGRNTRFLPIEFVPLTISTTLAEMGSKLKGQIVEAPSKATPSVTTDRLMMEALRMALSNAFIVFRLGHKLQWNHYAGMASTFAGAAVAVGTEMRK